MTTIVIIVIGLVAATVHLYASHKPRTADRALELYLLYTLLLGVGFGGLFGAMGHLLLADRVADSLGWATGSPFQTEVGLFDLAFGVLGICCIWIRGQWWVATAIGWSIFAVGAGVVHIRDLVEKGNNGLNAGSVLPDLLIPALLIALLVARWAVARRAAQPAPKAS